MKVNSDSGDTPQITLGESGCPIIRKLPDDKARIPLIPKNRVPKIDPVTLKEVNDD